MAEQQRHGALVGLAVASALMVLLASGVAISRLQSHDRPDGSGASSSQPVGGVETPSPAAPAAPSGPAAPSSPGAASGAPATGGVAPVAAGSGSAAGRRSSATLGARRASSSDEAPHGTAVDANSDATPARDSRSAASTIPPPPPGDGSGGGSAQPAPGDGSGGGSAQPAPRPGPGQADLVAASVSAGQGADGCVVGAGLGDSPNLDLTVGSNQVVGDAPPSNGTGVGLSGRLVHPTSSPPALAE